MKRIAFSILLTALVLVSLSSFYGKRELFPEIRKWKLNTEFPLYTPENLWDYINGAADGFINYGFQDLRMAEYKRGSNTIRVEVYRHFNSPNAFGIYASERSPDYNFIEVGAGGYLEGDILNFYNKDFYVKLKASSTKSKVIDMMREIAYEVSGNISRSPVSPEALRLFPQQGKEDKRETFIASNFLGHEFFNNVFVASYKVYGERFRVFITEKSSPEECRSLLEDYFAFTGQDADMIKQGKLIITDKYNGIIHLHWEDNALWGVLDTENHEIAEKYVKLTGDMLGK